MWSLAVSLVLAISGEAAGAPRDPTVYPDLSDPKAAAFSLGVALAKGDAKTARSIYIGKQKDFFALVDAMAKAAASAKKFSRAVTAKYGENAATLTIPAASIEPKLNHVRLTAVIAASDEKIRGKEATLVLGPSMEIRLKKEDKEWKVIEWPSLPPVLVDLVNASGPIYEELAGEVERGKYRKAYEVDLAFLRALKKRLSKILKNDKPKK